MTMWEARAESLPREELERQTLEGLRKTLGHVLANPAWRRRLSGVEPGDIRAIADWSRLSFLTKDELREAYPFGLACAGPERVVRIHMSSDDLRLRMGRALRVAPFDTVGMTESGGPGLGIDCQARAGIHVWEHHFFCEVVDPETGRPRADGEEGELVVSTLTREGLPLIRYRTRDLTRVLSRERCPCGRTHLRLDRLRGRTDDMVIFRGVNFYPQQVESLILKQPGVGHEYQIVLDRVPGGSDRLALLIEAREGFVETTLPRLRSDLKQLLNLSPELTVLKEGELPRPASKSVRVVDRR